LNKKTFSAFVGTCKVTKEESRIAVITSWSQCKSEIDLDAKWRGIRVKVGMKAETIMRTILNSEIRVERSKNKGNEEWVTKWNREIIERERDLLERELTNPIEVVRQTMNSEVGSLTATHILAPGGILIPRE